MLAILQYILVLIMQALNLFMLFLVCGIFFFF